MTWIKVSANATIIDGLATNTFYVLDPALGPNIRYRCANEVLADQLVTKLNSVDYP